MNSGGKCMFLYHIPFKEKGTKLVMGKCQKKGLFLALITITLFTWICFHINREHPKVVLRRDNTTCDVSDQFTFIMPARRHAQGLVPDYMSSVSKTFLSEYSNYLAVRASTDIKSLASNAFSVQRLLHNRTSFSLGEVIKVRMDLYDGYGQPLRSGGDILRIWMMDPSQNASVNGFVIDHKNGSYTGHVTALWTGKGFIKTSIAATKEHIALIINYIEKHGMFHYLFAGFKKGGVYERTNCSVKPDVYGLKNMCNFTNENKGLFWYCGRPHNPQLNCIDWHTVQGGKSHGLCTIGNKISTYHKHMLLKKSIQVHITGDKNSVPSKLTPCYQRPALETWFETSPVGYYYQDRWRLLKCSDTFNRTVKSYENCLRGRYIVLLGDSNIRSWYEYIRNTLNLKPPKDKEQQPKSWYSLFQSHREELNTTLIWAAHALPFYVGYESPKEYLKSVAWHMDRIPPVPNVVVVLHYMMHFARTSPSTLREHVRDARRAVDRLFKRSPDAKVFIKGPHSATFSGLQKPLDFIRKVQEQVLYEEFEGLHDKVVYLNEWDLTTGIANINVHPSHKTVRDMIDHFISYLCGD